MLKRIGQGAALAALVLAATVAGAEAGCTTTGTLLGAGAGSVALGALTHSPAGWVGGAVLGGVVGHSIASDNCHRDHYDRHSRYYRNRHPHRYADQRGDRA